MDQATIDAIANKVISETELQVAIIGLVGALVGGVVTLVGQYIMHKLSFSKEIRLKLIENQIKNFNEAESVVGEFVEELCSYKELDEEKYKVLLSKLEELSGKLKRYKEIAQAIRDVSHFGKILVAKRAIDPADTQERQDLNEKHNKFDVQLSKLYRSIGAI